MTPAGLWLLKVNNENNGTRCEICSKLLIKTPDRRQWRGCNFANEKSIHKIRESFSL